MELRRWILPLVLVLVGLSVGVPTPCRAGPNAGGVLLLHANTQLVYTVDEASWCGQAGLSACSLAVVELPLEPAVPRVFHVVAAFPSTASPRLKALSFGVDWDPSRLALLGSGPCGTDPFEVKDDGWPDPNTGVGMSWLEARTDLLTDVYWFAGYAYAEGESLQATTFAVRPHPLHGGEIADDAVPAAVDTIADYGRLGFGEAGSLPCPEALSGEGDGGGDSAEGDGPVPDVPEGGDMTGEDLPDASEEPGLAFVEVEPSTGAEFTDIVYGLKRDYGIRVLVGFVPDGVICRATDVQLGGVANDERVLLATRSAIPGAPPLTETSQSFGDAGFGRSLWNDQLTPDTPDTAWGFAGSCLWPERGSSPWPFPEHQTSTYMMGLVGVTLILMESRDSLDCAVTDTTENWLLPDDLNQLAVACTEGLRGLADAEPNAHLSFVVYEAVVAPTEVEPIRDEQYSWLADAFVPFGYSGDDWMASGFALNNDRRQVFHTDWYFAAIMLSDFCNAPLVRPRATLFGPALWTPVSFGTGRIAENLGTKIAHETCHIFGADDEYETSGCEQRCDDPHGYLHVPTENCFGCIASQDPCLMDGYYGPPYPVCESTRGQIGWRDSEASPDGVLDPIEQPFAHCSMRFDSTTVAPGDWIDIHKIDVIPPFKRRLAFSDWTTRDGQVLWDGYTYSGDSLANGPYYYRKNGTGPFYTGALVVEHSHPVLSNVRVAGGSVPHLQFSFTDADTHCGRARVVVRGAGQPDWVVAADSFYVDSPTSGREVDVALAGIVELSEVEVRVWDTGGGREDVESLVFVSEADHGRGGPSIAPRSGLGRPNPSSGSVKWELGADVGAGTEVMIFRADGRLVRRIALGPRTKSETSVEWNGRDDSGRQVPAGRYFAAIAGTAGSRSVGAVTITQ